MKISAKNKAKRLQFAQEKEDRTQNDCKNVQFTDESHLFIHKQGIQFMRRYKNKEFDDI